MSNPNAMNPLVIQKMIFWSGVGHFALCAGSLFVPVALQWRRHLKNLPLLLRQMFWTYAGYILATNLSFGLISTYASDEMINGSLLARGLTLFIGMYWLIRIGLQFTYFDRTVRLLSALTEIKSNEQGTWMDIGNRDSVCCCRLFRS